MTLYLLRPIKNWTPWYDCAFGFVVRASSEKEARRLAQENGGDESDGWDGGKKVDVPAWTDPSLSTCVVLQNDGPSEVIIRDFAAA